MTERTELASTKAYRRIRNAIIAMELQPGEPLRESDLIDRFDLKRMAIREATARLIREHLVVMRPGFGSHVAEVRLTDVGDIFEAREHTERLAARLVVRNSDSGDIEALSNLAEKTDTHPHFEVDLAFHNQVANMTGNRFVSNTLETLYAHSLRMFKATKSHWRSREQVVASHRHIVRTVSGGDVEEVERAILEHTDEAKELLLDSI